jgi:pyruvate dehydrogenase E2 component (dihydrolipoamide acetyltransferase)
VAPEVDTHSPPNVMHVQQTKAIEAALEMLGRVSARSARRAVVGGGRALAVFGGEQVARGLGLLLPRGSRPAALDASPAGQLRRWMSQWEAAIPLKMPALSPTMTHGTLTRWVKAEGDEIAAGDVVAEIDTDKATVGFEVQEDGFLAKIFVPSGTENVEVGRVLALMVNEKEEVPDVQAKDWEAVLGATGMVQEAAGSNDAPPAPAAPAAKADPVFGSQRVSPAAAALVRGNGLDISSIKGSGKKGMVTKADVLVLMGKAPMPKAAASKPAKAAPPPTAAVAAPTKTVPSIVDLGGALPSVEFEPASRPEGYVSPAAFSEVKPSNVRRVISSRLTESKATIPHSYAVMDCRIDGMLKLRKNLKAKGVAVSVNDLVIKAVAKSLRAVPEANCFFDVKSGVIRANKTVDISVAVATEGGLITPIVRDADALPVGDIGGKVKDLATRARAGKLAPAEFQGGSFTVSNLGMFGIDEFSAVINPPQACILAVGRGAERAVFAGDAMAFDVNSADAALDKSQDAEPELATVMSVMMSSDRRVVDDVIAAQFLASFKHLCEHPEQLLA